MARSNTLSRRSCCWAFAKPACRVTCGPTVPRCACRKHVAHEPDALVYCGPKLPDDSLEVPEPLVVVEVASPSTRKVDASLKLTGYFSLPSIQHYLIVDPDGPPVLHHRRQGDGTILTTIVHEGVLTLVPPGIELDVAHIFATP